MSLIRRIFLFGEVVAVALLAHAHEAGADFWSRETTLGGLVSAAGGIVQGSFSTSVFTNPAGLVQNDDYRVTAQGLSNRDGLGDPTFSGGVLYGQPSAFGLAAGITRATAGSGATSAFYGLGVDVAPISTSFGISGFTPMSPSGGSAFDAGLKSELGDTIDIGLAAFDIRNGPAVWGGGVAYKLGSGVKILSDFTTNSGFNDWEAQPGIWVSSATAALTVSYGFRFDKSQVGLGRLSDGLALGGGVGISQTVNVELYYQTIMKYYAAVSVRL